MRREKFTFLTGLLLFALFTGIKAQEVRPAENTSKGFFVKNGKLYDSKGYQFIIRGINNGHSWFDHPSGGKQAINSLDNIAGFGFNAVRVVWGLTYWSGGPTTDDQILKQILDTCIKYKLVPVVGLWDFTGPATTADLITCANWWAARASLVNQYEEHIIVNIANELGGGNSDFVSCNAWRDAYIQAVGIIRDAGIKATLLIDGTDWGKKIDCAKQKGTEVYKSDPLHNVIFAAHYYCPEWGCTKSKIINDMNWFANQDTLVMVVGEFAQKHANGESYCDVEEKVVVDLAYRHKIGYMAWAWNNGYFSMGNLWEAKTINDLTDWGRWLISMDPYGIQATSFTSCSFLPECDHEWPVIHTLTGDNAPINLFIYLRSVLTDKLVVVDMNNDQKQLKANGSVFQSDTSLIRFYSSDSTSFQIYAAINKKRIGINFITDGNPLSAYDNSYLQTWKEFIWEENDDTTFSIRSRLTGNYIRVDSVDFSLNADADVNDESTKFTYGLHNTLPDLLIPLPMQQLTGVLVYPNPVSGRIYVQGLNGQAMIEIITLQGSMVLRQSEVSAGKSIDLNRLEKGFYVIRIIQDDLQHIQKLIIK